MSVTFTTLPRRRMAKSKARLVEAGVRLLSDGGKKPPTTRELASEAGVNHALISYHFGGLAELMAAVVDRCIQDLSDMIAPEMERFTADTAAATSGQLALVMRDYAGKLLGILAGPRGAALLRALNRPEAAAVGDFYARFSAKVVGPLHHSFAEFAARARGIDAESLEALVLAQCMMAQAMAFFRRAGPVLRGLGKDALSAEELAEVSRIVADALCRTAGICVTRAD